MWNNTSRSVLKKANKSSKVSTASTVKATDAAVSMSSGKGKGYGNLILGGGWSGNVFDSADTIPDISEITYNTILRILSETIGKIPVHIRNKRHEIVQTDAEKLFSKCPNPNETMLSLMTYLEYCRNHYGNGYAWCKWSETTGKLEGIYALNPAMVRIWIDDVSDSMEMNHIYQYNTFSGKGFFLPAEDVIHVKSWLTDYETHLVGIPVRQILLNFLNSAKSSQEMQNDLYKNGMLTGVLNYVGKLDDEKQERLVNSAKKFGKGSRILPLPQDWKLTPVSMNLGEAQFLEGRRFNREQLSAAFGIPPTLLNDYSRGTFNNASVQQVQFLSDTILHIGSQYEQEMSRKILTDAEFDDGYRVDLDTNIILQNTPEALANILVKYVTGSIMTINEARNMAGLPPKEGADKLMQMPGAKSIDEKEVVVE